jgi:hypothetical protein
MGMLDSPGRRGFGSIMIGEKVADLVRQRLPLAA